MVRCSRLCSVALLGPSYVDVYPGWLKAEAKPGARSLSCKKATTHHNHEVAAFHTVGIVAAFDPQSENIEAFLDFRLERTLNRLLLASTVGVRRRHVRAVELKAKGFHEKEGQHVLVG